MRDQEKSREASLSRADGVVAPENLLSNHPGTSETPSQNCGVQSASALPVMLYGSFARQELPAAACANLHD
jgi:hypothetical protein